MKELHTIIHGKVQGVWFRAWTREAAQEMGLTGWVRNKSNGNVEAAIQGDEDQVRQFLERLYDGPPLARVTRIDSSWRDKDETLSSFEIRS